MFTENLLHKSQVTKSMKILNGLTRATELYERELKKYAVEMLDICVLHEEKKFLEGSLENFWECNNFPEDLAIDSVDFLDSCPEEWTMSFFNERKMAQDVSKLSKSENWSHEECEQIVQSMIDAAFDYYQPLCICCKENT